MLELFGSSGTAAASDGGGVEGVFVVCSRVRALIALMPQRSFPGSLM
jgi:hypothetical protein